VARRRELAQRYQRLLADIPGLEMIGDPSYGTTNYQSFWVVLPEDFPVTRNELMRLLAEAGVSARRGIMAAHLEPAYSARRHSPMPVTERLTASSVILPLFHQLTEQEQDLVVSVMLAAAADRRHQTRSPAPVVQSADRSM
jgi:dTDP-4-amino-4,6-dideoxygalactose transaminase